MRITSLIRIVVALSYVLISSLSAYAEVRQGSEVVVAEDEVVNDDLYLFAQTATVNGTIKGDLIVFGQTVTVNGSVEGDLLVAAQEVTVGGKISDDARITGQLLKLAPGANIGDDLVAASYSLECTQTSFVGGEVKYAGYQSAFAGRVEKKIKLASANCELSGIFGDDIDAVVEGSQYGAAGFWGGESTQVPVGLTVTETADIAGNLSYQSTDEANISSGSTISGTVEQTLTSSDVIQPTIASRAIDFAKQFFALMVVGLLVVFVCPKWTGQVVNNVQRRPLASFGWGVLSFIAAIVGAILLLVTTITVAVLMGYVSLDNLIASWLWLGILSTAIAIVGFIVYSAWIAKIIVAIWLGNRILNGPIWNSQQKFLALALGVLIFAAVSWIPTIGVAASVLVMLTGIGSTTIWMFASPISDAHGKPKV